MGELKRYTVDGLVFGHDDGSEEPRIRDIDLAVRLGYERPRSIRVLIGRLVRDGKLNNSALCHALMRSGGRPAQEYWLTEAQAIKVAARSDTEKADTLLDEVIRVFILARKGLLPPQAAPAAQALDLAAVVEMVRTVVGEMLPKMLAPAANDGVAGPEEGKRMRGALMRVALIDADGDRAQARRRRTRLDNEIRAQLEFFGSCRSWDNLPSMKYGAFKVLVEAAEKRATEEAKRRDAVRQPSLFSLVAGGQ